MQRRSAAALRDLSAPAPSTAGFKSLYTCVSCFAWGALFASAARGTHTTTRLLTFVVSLPCRTTTTKNKKAHQWPKIVQLVLLRHL
jgi:hypothetical protein